MASIKSDIFYVCAVCGLFIPIGTLRIPHRTDLLFERNINRRVFAETTLDCFAWNGDSYSFCSKCFTSILNAEPPKFGSVNTVNTTNFQAYPEDLKNLTAVEEAMIARVNPVINFEAGWRMEMAFFH